MKAESQGGVVRVELAPLQLDRAISLSFAACGSSLELVRQRCSLLLLSKLQFKIFMLFFSENKNKAERKMKRKQKQETKIKQKRKTRRKKERQEQERDRERGTEKGGGQKGLREKERETQKINQQCPFRVKNRFFSIKSKERNKNNKNKNKINK